MNRKQLSPLSVVETSDHHGVPQRVHLAAAVVHHSGQPGVDRLRTVAVTITQQLLVDTGETKDRKPKLASQHGGRRQHVRPSVCGSLHHLLDDLLEILVVGVVSGRSQDGVAVHLKQKPKTVNTTRVFSCRQLMLFCEQRPSPS